MAEEEGEGKGGRIPPLGKALGTSLLVDLICLPLAFVLLYVWPLVLLAIVPYSGGALGGRHVDRRTGLWTGALAAAVMVTVLVSLVLVLLHNVSVVNFDPLESTGVTIVSASYIVAVLFGALGGRHGAMAMEDE